LKFFGQNREQVAGWMNSLVSDAPRNQQNFVLMVIERSRNMDSTHSFSMPANLAVNAKGYNPDFGFEKQIRLTYLFSAQMKQPV
jgi:hypothetical protein